MIKHLTLSFLLITIASISYAQDSIDTVLVKKSERRMYLLHQGEIVKEYKVRFGANPSGHKEQEGDERTPEGKYMLDYKKEKSSFYKALHISYPNKADIEKAKLKNVHPGGQIMVHGQKNGLGWLSIITQMFNWTDGCIAVSNKEMDEIWKLVDTDTPIIIEK